MSELTYSLTEKTQALYAGADTGLNTNAMMIVVFHLHDETIAAKHSPRLHVEKCIFY